MFLLWDSNGNFSETDTIYFKDLGSVYVTQDMYVLSRDRPGIPIPFRFHSILRLELEFRSLFRLVCINQFRFSFRIYFLIPTPVSDCN